MTWATGSLVWFIDGVQTCRVTTGVPSTPMFVIVNVAMHGTVNASTLPQQTTLDYIKLTQP
jgi:beta-glucanase (GH16 family)